MIKKQHSNQSNNFNYSAAADTSKCKGCSRSHYISTDYRDHKIGCDKRIATFRSTRDIRVITDSQCQEVSYGLGVSI